MGLFLTILFATSFYENLEKESQLYRSCEISQNYSPQTAKPLPPTSHPQTLECLSKASVWYFSSKIPKKSNEWDDLRDLGIEALEIPFSKTNISQARSRGLYLLSSQIAELSSASPDFQLALRAYKEYPQLFHLIEIKQADWPLLGKEAGSIPMKATQSLRKKGYLEGRPEIIYPNSATSCWATTNVVTGCDGVQRRWIYIRQGQTPALNWLDPTFASYRLLGGLLAEALLDQSRTIVLFHAAPIFCHGVNGFLPSLDAIGSMALLTRKLGGFSALKIDASLKDLQTVPTDLWVDHFTGPSLQHALMTEDAESLRQIYRAFLKEGIQPRSFIHELPIQASYEETVSSPLLQERLVKEDIARLYETPSRYTPDPGPLICDKTPPWPSVFFYAMQPGVFSLQELDPPPSLQLKKPSSFASRLQALFRIRKKLQLASAELIDVLPVQQKGLIALLHRLPQESFSLTVVNFSSSEKVETIRHPRLIGKWAINAVTGLTEPKAYERDQFDVHLEALSGKVFLFQFSYTEHAKE